jgi:hypothetical protein
MSEKKTNEEDLNTSKEDTASGDRTWTDSLFGASESIRTTLSSTLRNALNNDEGIRKVIRDILPKEVVGHVIRNVDQGKDEIVKVVGVQTRKFLEGIDLGKEIQKVLTSVSLEFKTELRFIPNDQAVRPEGRVAMKVTQGDTEIDSGSIPIPTMVIRDAIMGSLNALSAAFQRGGEGADAQNGADTSVPEANEGTEGKDNAPEASPKT